MARFILIALYTGRRKDSILKMGFVESTDGGWFDLDSGRMYCMGTEERVTKKRRNTARIPRPLAAHLRRWHALGATWAVEYQGSRVGDI